MANAYVRFAAIEATAHGYAALLTDHPGTLDPGDVARAAEQAGRATRALIRGRAALGSRLRPGVS